MIVLKRERMDLDDFIPHPWLSGGHRQTVAGLYLRSPWKPGVATPHYVRLTDGDTVVLHDNCPSGWQPGDWIVLLLHGLCGCYESPYMQRIAAKLNGLGVRTFCLDHRGWGEGWRLAQQAMHAGRSDDFQQSFLFVQNLCPRSPSILVGFSLGANVLLKLLAEWRECPPPGLKGGIAVSPPMDLVACARNLQKGWPRWYQRYFLVRLMAHVQRATHSPPWAERLALQPRVRSLWEFDHCYTAPLSGFTSAEDYYDQCSTIDRLDEIRVSTHILAAQDDPLVPSFRDLVDEPMVGSHVHVHLPRHGGHLGFVARGRGAFDGRWLDWRVVQWIEEFRARMDRELS